MNPAETVTLTKAVNCKHRSGANRSLRQAEFRRNRRTGEIKMASARTTHRADRYCAIRRGAGVLLLLATAGLLVACGGGAEQPSGSGSIGTVGGDSIAPSTPALTASAVSPSQINLSWSASSDNVAVVGYQVFRGGALLVTLGNTTTYQNAGLTPSTSYTYTVRAFDMAGNVSGQSMAANAMTQADTTAPSIPSGLNATAISASQINLSWAASTDNVAVTGYRIFRGGTLLITLGNVTTYQNTLLNASTQYSYTVLALDAAGNASAQSTAANAMTLPPPACVTGVSPANLTWDAVDPVAHPSLLGYRIYYGTAPGVYDQPLGTGTQVAFINTNAQVILSSGTYYFAVTAYSLTKESDFSNEVCKTIQ
jgi:chitodextrinase